METIELTAYSKGSFSLLRGVALIAAVALPVVFLAAPPAPWWVLLSAPAYAAGWLAAMMLSWRHRSYLWAWAGTVILMVLPRFLGPIGDDVGLPWFFQWLCLLLFLAGLPLLLFRRRMLRWARLEEGEPRTPDVRHETRE